MKKISSVFFCLYILVSCGKGGDSMPNSGALINSEPLKSGLSDSSERIVGNPPESLEIQIPMSNEQLKNWIPQKVGEMQQRKLIVGHKQAMGMSGAISTYQDEDEEGKQVSLEVLDGAGATGAVIVKSMMQKLTPDYEEQLATGHSRIYEREGFRVWEKVNSQDHSSEIEFVTDGRYYFIFKGHEIEMDELWAFVREVRKQMS